MNGMNTAETPKKIMPIIGTRPEAIKLAPVIHALQRYPEYFNVVPVLTAQHREMLDQMCSVFNIQACYDLNIMLKGQSLADVTTRALQGIAGLIDKEKPDMIMAQGDTTTVFSAALSSFYYRIPFAHVEAGLRTQDRYSPFPEEINRRLTSPLTEVHLAPTETARRNLLKENIKPETIYVTGNTVIDALFYILDKPELKQQNLIETLNIEPKKFILVTAHRRESFGEPFRHICHGLKKVADAYPDYTIVYPVHLNPNVQQPVNEILSGSPNVRLIEPLDYVQFIHLLKDAYLVITDSGGIQEEAPSLGIPVLVLREITERPEAVEAGTVKLVGSDTGRIFGEVQRLMENRTAYDEMARAINPYGDGKAAERIISVLKHFFKIGHDCPISEFSSI